MTQRGARIVVLSSAAHKSNPIHLDDLQWTQRPHVDGAAYAESKSANNQFAQEATRRWRRATHFRQRGFARQRIDGPAALSR